jgi:hypothetical protein
MDNKTKYRLVSPHIPMKNIDLVGCSKKIRTIAFSMFFFCLTHIKIQGQWVGPVFRPILTALIDCIMVVPIRDMQLNTFDM